MKDENGNEMGTTTQLIHRIVDESVRRQAEQQRQLCEMHKETLKTYGEAVGKIQSLVSDLGRTVSVVSSHVEDIKKNRDELYGRSHSNQQNIAVHAELISGVSKEVQEHSHQISDIRTELNDVGNELGNTNKEVSGIISEQAEEKSEKKDTRAIKWAALIAIATVLLQWLFEIAKIFHK